MRCRETIDLICSTGGFLRRRFACNKTWLSRSSSCRTAHDVPDTWHLGFFISTTVSLEEKNLSRTSDHVREWQGHGPLGSHRPWLQFRASYAYHVRISTGLTARSSAHRVKIRRYSLGIGADPLTARRSPGNQNPRPTSDQVLSGAAFALDISEDLGSFYPANSRETPLYMSRITGCPWHRLFGITSICTRLAIPSARFLAGC